MELDLNKVARYIRRAETEELLDRVTVYRDGMEPAAVDLMENELARRGLSPAEIEEHDRFRRETAILLADGAAMRLAVASGGVLAACRRGIRSCAQRHARMPRARGIRGPWSRLRSGRRGRAASVVSRRDPTHMQEESSDTPG